ncbi:MAG: hypothetical protein JWR61_3341 [Ferruginibacter sp.]|uniref:hypothetical protein n=1 Tax=Ferruginibacter sp. TaxID=1940288 RepID=UPI00265B710B|nr:hypothetical protein [Ferruginibacter sp.]MDB5278386.1 hypothetical protein [Ferruginibacter sp.]
MNGELSTYIFNNGITNTFETFKKISNQKYKHFNTVVKFPRMNMEFEFELFVMAFFLLQIEAISDSNISKGDFEDRIERYYGKLVDKFLIDPMERRLFNLTVPNADIFAYRKFKSYQREIILLEQDCNYVSKYLFSAFNMVPLMDNEYIEKACMNLVDENIMWFQLLINDLLKSLILYSKNLNSLNA